MCVVRETFGFKKTLCLNTSLTLNNNDDENKKYRYYVYIYMCVYLLAHAGGTKTTRTAFSRFQVFHFDALRRGDSLQNHLRDSVAFLHLEILVSKVGQNDADVSTVVVIDHTG